MKTIYLQRQGSTDTFNTHNAINTDLGYYIEVKTWSDNRYNIIIASTRKQAEDDTKNKRIEITAVYPSLSDAFRRVEKELREELSEDATISDTIEKYCHNNFTYKKVSDKYLAVCSMRIHRNDTPVPRKLLPRLFPAQRHERLPPNGQRNGGIPAHIGGTGQAIRKGGDLDVPQG